MLTVEKGIIKVDGKPIAFVKESKYPVPAMVNVNYDKPKKYILKGVKA